MKRYLITLLMLLTASTANAEFVTIESNVTMDNFWQKNGKEVEKVLTVSRNIIHTNKLKRAPIDVYKSLGFFGYKNAGTNLYNKSIGISKDILPYFDSDDELAFVLSHELAHAQEAYDGGLKVMSMKFNSKKYEYKSDLMAIDYMVKAHYNPIAAITVGNKVFEEPLWDWGFMYSHPKGSKRLLAMYKYIYKKYPSYLNSDLAKTATYIDFTNQYSKEISAFKQKEAKKAKKMQEL